jgi:protein-S-isoprenylcysteine O-methyltransferase Ste14
VARWQFRTFRLTWGLSTDRLTTTGIYGISRHPQNLGWGLTLLGVALWGASGVALVLVALYAAACALWLPAEERALQARFGAVYAEYRRATSVYRALQRREP